MATVKKWFGKCLCLDCGNVWQSPIVPKRCQACTGQNVTTIEEERSDGNGPKWLVIPLIIGLLLFIIIAVAMHNRF